MPELQKTISLTSHPSKVMLKIILNRVMPQQRRSSLKKSTNLVRVIKNLYDKATSAVLFNSGIEG